MGWETVSLSSPKVAKDLGFISIGSGKIAFSYKFLRNNDIEAMKFVRVFVDQEEFKIGFLFLEDRKDDNCLMLNFRNRDRSGARIGIEALRKYPFIRQIERFENARDRRFIAVPETSQFGKVWVIRGAPSFDVSVSRSNLSSIPSDASGVYRYLKNEETVYIGKGQIKRRVQESQRSDWDFDTVQYSIIEREDKDAQGKEQFRWEHHWISYHKQNSGGSRPKYNRNDGVSDE